MPKYKTFFSLLQPPQKRLLLLYKNKPKHFKKQPLCLKQLTKQKDDHFQSVFVLFLFLVTVTFIFKVALLINGEIKILISQMMNSQSRDNVFDFDMLLDMKQEITLCPQTLEEFPDDILFQQQNIMCYSSRGGHIHNEDKFDFIINDDYIIAAIYDGHGGSTVSFYLKENLLKNIIQHKDFHLSPQKSIFECINNIQEEVISKFSETSGSTLAIVLWKKDSLIVANVGDTLCFGFQSEINRVNKLNTNTNLQHSKQDNLEDQYSKMQLCEMHNLQNQKQRNKVRKMGGAIFKAKNTYRVSGELNLSRSIGDKKYKKWISSQPYIKKYQNTFNNIILASDGFVKKLQPMANPSQIHALIQSAPYLKDNSTLIMIGRPDFSA